MQCTAMLLLLVCCLVFMSLNRRHCLLLPGYAYAYVMGRKRGASKKAKISTNTPDSTMPPEELETDNVFSHDMDTLECEICSLPFDSQIFMASV